MHALQQRDTIALDTLMAADFRLSGPTDAGEGVDKATWIRNAQTLITTDSAAYRAMRFRTVAPGVVVGSGVLYWRTRMRGWPIPVRSFAVTDVWVREANTGRWQIAVRNADMVPGVFLTFGALAGAALMAVLWMVTAWWQRRRLRMMPVATARSRSIPAPGAAAPSDPTPRLMNEA
jgi:hypothetical protein